MVRLAAGWAGAGTAEATAMASRLGGKGTEGLSAAATADVADEIEPVVCGPASRA